MGRQIVARTTSTVTRPGSAVRNCFHKGFYIRDRLTYDPATGEQINIPAKKVVKFRVAKAVKDAIVPAKSKKAAI
jgi:hypothetical protein